MKAVLFILTIVSLSFNAMGQNKHPMKIGMVSVLVEDPVKAFKYYTEVLGFEEVMFAPESHIAIVRSPLEGQETFLLLEPIGPSGLEVVTTYKNDLYALGIPVISFSSDDIMKTAEELKKKGVLFKKDPVKTDFGYEAIFDDDNGNYIQLIQLQ